MALRRSLARHFGRRAVRAGLWILLALAAPTLAFLGYSGRFPEVEGLSRLVFVAVMATVAALLATAALRRGRG